MSEDPRDLARARPFDPAFIDTTPPRHESAVAMANVALEEIVSGQERELSQMREWREEWYPQG